MITVSTEYEKLISSQSLLSDFSQKTSKFTEVKNSLDYSKASMNDGMEFQGASVSYMSQKLCEKNKISATDSLKSPKRNYIISTDSAFLNSNVRHPTLRPSSKPDLHRDDSLRSQLSIEKNESKPRLTSLILVQHRMIFN